MPPTPSLPQISRAAPILARSMATSSKPPPSKDHHIITYPSDAFPRGYALSSTHAGIKKKAGAHDLGILVSTASGETSAAACMTRNVFKAAPVLVTASLLHSGNGRAKGFIVNAGCANAVTGKKGMEDAWTMSNTVTGLLSSNKSSSVSESVSELGSGSGSAGTLVMSTGVIGQHLPIDKITSQIPSLVNSLENTPSKWLDLAKAFMTTDTFPKLRTRKFTLGNQIIRMAGIDKGAGMIAPNMGPPQPPHGTLLGIIATDAAVEPKALQSALQYAVDRSFNSITVDGDMSTNDTVIALANGAAEGSSFKEITENDPEFKVFREELRGLAEDLAKLVARDGEGATKFVTVKVVNAPSEEVASAVAKSVASSSLVKCALYGEDANWGRILCAVGYTPLPENTISPTSVSVQLTPSPSTKDQSSLKLLTNGEPEPNIDEDRASEILKEEDLEIVVDLGNGKGEATVWTCDFSHDYVTINGSVFWGDRVLEHLLASREVREVIALDRPLASFKQANLTEDILKRRKMAH